MKILLTIILSSMLLASLFVLAREDNRGRLGRVSTGLVDVSLRINEDIRAGLLPGQGGAESDLETLVSSGLVNGIADSEKATLSLCIISSGRGMFEVTSLEHPGQATAYTRSGTAVPLQVGFGTAGSDTIKQRAAEIGCTHNAVVPVTVQLDPRSVTEAGRVHGRLELLVKSE